MGTSMARPWCFHGPSSFHRAFMVRPWCVHGVSMVTPWARMVLRRQRRKILLLLYSTRKITTVNRTRYRYCWRWFMPCASRRQGLPPVRQKRPIATRTRVVHTGIALHHTRVLCCSSCRVLQERQYCLANHCISAVEGRILNRGGTQCQPLCGWNTITCVAVFFQCYSLYA